MQRPGERLNAVDVPVVSQGKGDKVDERDH